MGFVLVHFHIYSHAQFGCFSKINSLFFYFPSPSPPLPPPPPPPPFPPPPPTLSPHLFLPPAFLSFSAKLSFVPPPHILIPRLIHSFQSLPFIFIPFTLPLAFPSSTRGVPSPALPILTSKTSFRQLFPILRSQLLPIHFGQMTAIFEKRRHSELPPHFQHKFSLPHNDLSIAAAAAEGARMGVEGAKLGPLSHQMFPPRKESAKQMSSGGVQVFLCFFGALLSVCVSLWMAMFSKDSLPRRISISAVAGVCSLIFALLAYAAFKKRTIKTPIDDIEISQSILREHRKSMTNSLRKNTASGEELLGQIRRHSSVIAVDQARQHLLQQQQKTANNHLLSADSPRTKRERASTSD